MVRILFLAFAAITAIVSTGVLASPSERINNYQSRDLLSFAKRGCGTIECCEAGCEALGGGAGPDECCAYGMQPCCGIGDGGSGGGGGGGGGGACGDECEGDGGDGGDDGGD